LRAGFDEREMKAEEFLPAHTTLRSAKYLNNLIEQIIATSSLGSMADDVMVNTLFFARTHNFHHNPRTYLHVTNRKQMPASGSKVAHQNFHVRLPITPCSLDPLPNCPV
jgi:hypothetical protein